MKPSRLLVRMLCPCVEYLRKKQFPVFRLVCVASVVIMILTGHFILSSERTVERNKRLYPDPMSVDIRSMSADEQGFHVYTLDNIIAAADPKKCANAKLSVIKLSSEKREFQLGETIQVEVQLFDSYKQRKTKGGDFVRVMIKEDSKVARAAAAVTDNNDGTYTGSVKALWTGNIQIEATVVGFKENMDIFKRMFRDHYTLRDFIALFESDGVKEETKCRSIPRIPGYVHVCNLTAENYGLPWYCGKPSRRKLLCHDFKGLTSTNKQLPHLTVHEDRFFDKGLLHQKIPEQVQIKVVSDKETVPLPTIPCNKSPLRLSWEATTPVGFFYKNQWISLTCKNTIPTDPQTYRKCLKNRTLWIHGDSTSRQWFVDLKKRLGLQLLTETWYSDKWHQPAVLRDKVSNTMVMFAPHEYPFYHGEEFRKLALNRPTHVYLDELPSDATDIFIIHLYLHFIPSPPELFRVHIKRIVGSLKALFARAPKVQIAVRGAHAFKALEAKAFLDDIWMWTFDAILKEEFKEIEDKVLFLNNRDLTTVTEIDNPHPTETALRSLIHHFMGYICAA